MHRIIAAGEPGSGRRQGCGRRTRSVGPLVHSSGNRATRGRRPSAGQNHGIRNEEEPAARLPRARRNRMPMSGRLGERLASGEPGRASRGSRRRGGDDRSPGLRKKRPAGAPDFPGERRPGREGPPAARRFVGDGRIAYPVTGGSRARRRAISYTSRAGGLRETGAGPPVLPYRVPSWITTPPTSTSTPCQRWWRTCFAWSCRPGRTTST